ncbi:unnamed protein product [Didymodactylos carnosus]|uniref:Transposase Tc1-like domain-containing protein n=1 Tax=Didymodactylos carnosus TaxID=1234261 RepID=A0A815F7F8_9BILA|nr:unnamed protein product [Didymodactylos carnosus]CAF1321267.1 unnamed protein product [Didymodactylos carnosus]CAF4070986.1 unnamed protein product [Didymodactylos carnosus]CAF4167254.1 unnamed protein product [Didymodactylos carnosus]
MKSKDTQEPVLRLHKEGLNENEIHEHLRGTVSRATIYSWVKSINRSGTIDLTSPKGRPRIIHTKTLTQKVTQRLSRKKKASSRILAKEMKVSHTTMRRIIKEDLGLKPYVKRVAPKLTEQHKIKRRSFGIWVRKNIRQSMKEKILFSDEKYFDIDGI